MPPSPAREYRSSLFPPEPRFVPVHAAGQDVELAVVETGPREAEPVLLLHGNPTWSFLYRDVMPRLGPDVRAIAPDFLGFGRSDKLAAFEDYTLAAHLASFEQLVDRLGLEKVTLVVDVSSDEMLAVM